MSKIESLVEQWLAIDPSEKTRNEIKQLFDEKNYEELEKRLSKRIEFGTAGLRARMEAGFARMNDVTVLQASQGLAKYVQKNVNNAEKRGIVIGHDHRHNSARFAELTALAFGQLGFKVFQFGLVHTPLVPFGVDELGAACGVMVTASHNPAADNGYKVYWCNGCQIIPPHDSGIARTILDNLEPWTWDVSIMQKFDLDTLIVSQVENHYFERLASKLDYFANDISSSACLTKFVYTPMHGVGLPFMTRAAKLLGMEQSMIVVDEQARPDPDFPTVKFPNPEEHGALDLAQKVADHHGCRVILANDPDADRFTAAFKSRKSGKWVQMTGNQLGAIFGNYAVKRYEDENGGDVSKLTLLNSTVSSEFNATLAKQKGFRCIDTLTGFKWIGNGAIDCENQGYRVPFAFEEAIGYMFGGVVHDKDGISAAYVFMQLVALWAMQATDALEKLEELYNQYGYFAEHNSYYIVPDPSFTAVVFNRIRSIASPYPETIGKYKVIYWRDLTVGYDSTTPGNVPMLPVSRATEMITVKLETPDGDSTKSIRFTARGSGTEPKLKVYIEARSSSEQDAQHLADDVWDELRKEWFPQAELTQA